MKYYCLLKIPFGNKDYIEVGSNFFLPFHPNITDKIEIFGFDSKIDEICCCFENIHNGEYATIRLSTDGYLIKEEKSEEILKAMQELWDDLHKYDQTIILNDYTMNIKTKHFP